MSVKTTKLLIPASQGGYSGINMTGGSTEPNILHPKKIEGPYIVHPKNTRLLLHADYSYMLSNLAGTLIGLNCVRTISQAENRTQKNTRRFFRPKKIHG